MGRTWKAFVLGLAGVAATATLTFASVAVAGSWLSSPAEALDVKAPLLAPRETPDPNPADKHSTTRTPGAAPSGASTDVNGPSSSRAAGSDSPSEGASAPSTPGTDTGDADGSEPHDAESDGSDDTQPGDHGDD